MERLRAQHREIEDTSTEKLPEGILRNEEGIPVTVYRGSSLPVSFSKEDRYKRENLGYATEAPSAGQAFFFTNRRSTADYYSRGQNPNKETAIRKGETPHIDTAFLVMKNPLIHDFKGAVNRGSENTYFNLLKKAQEEGNDGVIFRNTFDAGELSRLHALMQGKFIGETIYAVFDPEQVVIQSTEELVSPKKKKKILSDITEDTIEWRRKLILKRLRESNKGQQETS